MSDVQAEVREFARAVAESITGSVSLCPHGLLMGECSECLATEIERAMQPWVRRVEAGEKLAEALTLERKLELFDCPHEAEDRCACASWERTNYAKYRADREAGLREWEAAKGGK